MKDRLMKAYVGLMKKVYKADEIYKDAHGVWHVVWKIQ